MLTTKQRRVARAVYEGQLTEEQLCREFGITLKLLRRWLVSEELQRELARLCETSARETRLIINRYGPIAAAKLVTLLDSDKEDIARRSALDMIDRCCGERPAGSDENETDNPAGISDEQARRMLLTLAEGIRCRA